MGSDEEFLAGCDTKFVKDAGQVVANRDRGIGCRPSAASSSSETSPGWFSAWSNTSGVRVCLPRATFIVSLRRW